MIAKRKRDPLDLSRESPTSLSLIRYTHLGGHCKPATSLAEITGRADCISIPKLKDASGDTVTITSDSNIGETQMQVMFNLSYCTNQRLGRGYYCRDTHSSVTFLGQDLKPDIVVTSDNKDRIGEYSTMFLIDLKATNINPSTNENCGQAAAYLTRLLECSPSNFRKFAICCVTNFHQACVVQVIRQNGGYKIVSHNTSVETALGTLFNCDHNALGLVNEHFKIRINERDILPLNYLGSGSTAIVYSTTKNRIVKFYYSDHMTNEKNVLNVLNQNNRNNLILQSYIGEYIDDSTQFSCALLAPLGIRRDYPFKETYLPKVLFFSIWSTIKHAHALNIIHNDIRHANIIYLKIGIYILIDWGAAWNVSSMQKANKDDDKSGPIYRGQYNGSVITASDSILNDLINSQQETMQRTCTSSSSAIDAMTHSSKSNIVHASYITDIIAFLRTMFLFLHYGTPQEYKKLCHYQYIQEYSNVIQWWKSHLPPIWSKLETRIQELYRNNLIDDIYDAVKTHFDLVLPDEI